MLDDLSLQVGWSAHRWVWLPQNVHWRVYCTVYYRPGWCSDHQTDGQTLWLHQEVAQISPESVPTHWDGRFPLPLLLDTFYFSLFAQSTSWIVHMNTSKIHRLGQNDTKTWVDDGGGETQSPASIAESLAQWGPMPYVLLPPNHQCACCQFFCTQICNHIQHLQNLELVFERLKEAGRV